MSDQMNSISSTNPSYGISLNTPVPVRIAAAQFDLFIGGTSVGALDTAIFDGQQVFTSIRVVNGATDVIDVEIELVNSKGIFTRVIPMRIGTFMTCRARRILSASTDASAVLVVGVGV